MGLLSFVGRLLFVSFFFFTAWQEFNGFGDDGGSKAKDLKPKFDLCINYAATAFGISIPRFEIKHIVAAGIAFKGIGGILFLLGSSIGASLLLLYLVITALAVHEFYQFSFLYYTNKEALLFFQKFTQMVFMTRSPLDIKTHLSHLGADNDSDLALLGALLFFLEMKKKSSTIQRRHARKKPSKSKSA